MSFKFISGDGGSWIKSSVNYVPDSLFCFDKYHLTKYINQVSGQMLDEADTARAEIYRLLYKRRKKELMEYLDKMINCANNQKPVTDLKTLIMGNWDAIMRTLHNKILCGCSAESCIKRINQVNVGLQNGKSLYLGVLRLFPTDNKFTLSGLRDKLT